MQQRTIDMNQVVGTHSILFLCLDSLRYDVAVTEEKQGGTPNLNQYAFWQKRQAPGNFTYPSHQAMFAGFLPAPWDIVHRNQRERLFFAGDGRNGSYAPKGAFHFQGATWVEGLAKEGYKTYCIGGLSFFDGRSQLGKVMPSFFQHLCWNPSFGPSIVESAKNQIYAAVRILERSDKDSLLFIYINISATHYPCYMYLEHNKKNTRLIQRKDTVEAQRAALRYVDGELGRLFVAFLEHGKTFVICCSDHGTCFGEDGCWYHGFYHPLVNTVPYKHFFL